MVDTIKASDIGYNITDATAILQEALDSDATTVVIDYVPGGWTTGPLFLRRSDVRIEIEPQVMIRSRGGAFRADAARLLTISDQSNITISGYGATLAMNSSEYTDESSQRHALTLLGCSNVTVEGLVIRDSGGDGIYLGVSGTVDHNSAITLRDLASDNHRRQGITVTSIDGLLIDGCAFTGTQGIPGQTGINFSPGNSDARLADIEIRNCVIDGNSGGGLGISVGNLNDASAPISLIMEATRISGQKGSDAQVRVVGGQGNGKGAVAGTIELRDVLIDTSSGSGAVYTRGMETEAAQTVLTRTTVWNVDNAQYGRTTFELMPRGHSFYGNLTITDGVVVTDQPEPYLAAKPESGTTVRNVHGSVTVFNRNGVADPDFGANPIDVDLTTIANTAAPVATVSLSVAGATVTAGGTATVTFTRSGGELPVPLAVAYAVAGSARERFDYIGLGKVVTFPPGQTEATVEVRTHAHGAVGGTTNLVLAIDPSPNYLWDGVTASLAIEPSGDSDPDPDPDPDPEPDPEAPTIVFDGVDTGVPNLRRADGTSFLDRLDRLGPFATHAQFVRAVSQVAAEWTADGLLTVAEAGVVKRAASRSTVGR